MKKYADVIISTKHKDVDKIFAYKITEETKDLVMIGSRVLVPFGKSNKIIEGYVIGFSDEIDFDESKLKQIHSLPDDKPMFTEDLIQLSLWMKEKYYTTLANVLSCIKPAGTNIKTDYIISVVKDEKKAKQEKIPLSKKADEIVTYILDNKNAVTLEELKEQFNTVTSSISTLEKNGVITKTLLSNVKDYTTRLKYISLNDNASEDIDDIIQSNNAQSKVLKFLKQRGTTSLSDILHVLNISSSPINTLVKKNLITVEKVEVRRNVFASDGELYKDNVTLTDEQCEALDFLKQSLRQTQKKPVLIHGVTGSGKTEIYLKIIEQVLKTGKEAIVLVPEISLTPQTVSRFTSRFKDKVSVTHSRLTYGERYDQFKKARDGQISIMIGPRSAVFTPFKNLGIIIIDEQHESSFNSEQTPKYNAIDVSIKRAEITDSLVVLGSATPDIKSYYKAQNGEYHLKQIKKRINDSPPDIQIIDMRKELLTGNRSIFSIDLRNALIENVKQGMQTILFLNRRGHSTYVSCRSCGFVISCLNCNVNYTYHKYIDKLICHYCGEEIKMPSLCPQCNSKFIKYFGTGTQKIEEEVKKLLPDEAVLRMDMDTVSHKNAHQSILTKFRNGEAKILIGTQMIAKGLDFPNVTVVGIIAADISLNNGDYRASEITFQLLSQVSGRAGRDKAKGKVFIQTYMPEHYSIIFAKEHNYQKFYEHEIAIRRQMMYPPFSDIATIYFVSEDERDIIKKLFKLAEIMLHYNKNDQFGILGPAPCIISKVKNKFRWKIIVKSVDEQKLKNYIFFCLKTLEKNVELGNIYIDVTVNPVIIL